MRYSPERKEAILKKMAPPMSLTIPELAEQEATPARVCRQALLDRCREETAHPAEDRLVDVDIDDVHAT